MQTLIIGGTSNLGAGLAEKFKNLGSITVTGRELDIASLTHRITLLDMMSDYDIIINNAYCGDNQRSLLLNAFDRYKDTNKIFVNVESIHAWREGNLTKDQIEYATDKLALVTARKHLQKLPRKMKIIGVCPSIIDTTYNKNKQVPKMSIDHAAEIIFGNVVLTIDTDTEVSEIIFQKVRGE
jgi:NAD(P)-dependent dehydrogenase (short-subunit alcohol dehydrogenase family)